MLESFWYVYVELKFIPSPSGILLHKKYTEVHWNNENICTKQKTKSNNKSTQITLPGFHNKDISENTIYNKENSWIWFLLFIDRWDNPRIIQILRLDPWYHY